MNYNVLKNQARDLMVDALIIGGNAVRWTLYQIRELEPPLQPASIQHYGTKEAPLDGAPQPCATNPDYTRQLAFHQQQLLQGLPEAMQAHHLDMVNRLGKAA